MEREVGGGIGMGNTCKPMAVSFQCMTKFTTNKKKKRSGIKTLLLEGELQSTCCFLHQGSLTTKSISNEAGALHSGLISVRTSRQWQTVQDLAWSRGYTSVRSCMRIFELN